MNLLSRLTKILYLFHWKQYFNFLGFQTSCYERKESGRDKKKKNVQMQFNFFAQTVQELKLLIKIFLKNMI